MEEYIETFSQQIDCGEKLTIIMSIILPFFVIFSLLICWIMRPYYPQQASSTLIISNHNRLIVSNIPRKRQVDMLVQQW
ncbi:unnamed protein product [Rotaria sordida]|uniref:Uncharacterized protein n=1 Tax=Rotaria sordida TaxID=392033 RepID=A0A815EIU2_9BILA|nr:unnamed protein product [Rotaria sordida]